MNSADTAGLYSDLNFYVLKLNKSVAARSVLKCIKVITARVTMDDIFTMSAGIVPADNRNGQHMKRNRQIIRPRTRLSLGDLILAVSSCTRSSTEMVAAVADLLASGQVRVQDNGRYLRARVC